MPELTGMLSPEYSDFSVFSFQGKDKMFAESTGEDFISELLALTQEAMQNNYPIRVAIDLTSLPPKFIESQELVRQLHGFDLTIKKHKAGGEIILVGSSLLPKVSGLMWNREKFRLTDFVSAQPRKEIDR